MKILKLKILKLIYILMIMCVLLVCTLSLYGCNGHNKNNNQNNWQETPQQKPEEKPTEKEKVFSISINKQEYFNGEEFYVTAKGNENCIVGLFRKSDNIGSVAPIWWYNAFENGFISGNTYAFRKISTLSSDRQALRNIPQGAYKFALYKKSDNSVQDEVDLIVKSEKIQLPKAPTKMTYNINDTTSGLADGTLSVEFSDNSYAEEIAMFWGDDNGVLTDYTGLAILPVYSNKIDLKMYENTIIPANATKLIAYGKNSLGISTNYCQIDLPNNSAFNFDGEVINEFQVVSDIHIALANSHLSSGADTKKLHDEHLLAMANDIAKNSPNSSGIFVVGDIANSGRQTEWEHAKQLFESVPDLANRYFAIGNHDLYGSETYNELLNNYFNYAKTDKVYYDRLINGYHHIFLGSETKGQGLYADLSKTQLDWLDIKLKEFTQAEPTKPVFIYLHQSLYNTIAGSFQGQGWNGIIQNDELKSILEKYKQAYMFNGHSHWDLNTRGSMYNSDNVKIFNTSSVAYLWSSMYIPEGEYLKGSQGYYIKVYKDKVVILGRDFENKKWIPSACFVAKINN